MPDRLSPLDVLDDDERALLESAPAPTGPDAMKAVLGYYEGDELRYAGKVGTGFDHVTLSELGARLRALQRTTPPFAAADADAIRKERDATWAAPELVAQIGFTEWTRDGRLRHPRFQGLRDDKPARDVVRER